MTKWVYTFGDGEAEGRPATGICWAAKAPIWPKWPVSACPCRPGFTITTEVCTYYYANGQSYPAGARGPGRQPRWTRSAG